MPHAMAGQAAPSATLIDVGALEREFFERVPDPSDGRQRVAFGTSGHRGTPLDGTFTASHIVAITQAICEYRQRQGIGGPLYIGKDTHALSTPAQTTALEVLAGNGVETIVQQSDGFTPTPVISRAILAWNDTHGDRQADGIVVTPSHNPPNGGPADTGITRWIQDRANELLLSKNAGVLRIPGTAALRSACIHQEDLVGPYVERLRDVVDLDAIRAGDVTIGVDPLGGASLAFWEAIAERYRLKLTIVNRTIDPTFGFMTLDHDGRIRMDCSSPYAMASLVALRDRYDVAIGNDPDADRHGIVTPSAGLMNPNHFLAVAIEYLLDYRPAWSPSSAVGKTIVSSSMIDRVVQSLERRLAEVPVGFKWFAPGLFDGSMCFGGEESAGASFLKKDAAVWTTDKDGLIMGLLAAEMTARTGEDPGERYKKLESRFGSPRYTRIDAPASPEQKVRLSKLAAEDVRATSLAGERIEDKLTRAPFNDESIGGLKVMARSGWFAARPSGTENVYKIYAESFSSASHLADIVSEAQRIVDAALAG